MFLNSEWSEHENACLKISEMVILRESLTQKPLSSGWTYQQQGKRGGKIWKDEPMAVRRTNCAAFCLLIEGQLRRKTLPEWEEASAKPYLHIIYTAYTLTLVMRNSDIKVLQSVQHIDVCDFTWYPHYRYPYIRVYSPSTVPILLVRTESVWSSQPPPQRPSLKRLRIDWLESSTTRIHKAAVTVLEWRCSSMNIKNQSKPNVRTSSSHAL